MELNRLIETEQRNDALVRQASEAAEGIVQAAREAVQRKEAAFGDELQGVIRTNAGLIAAERLTRVARINAVAAEEISRYETTSDVQVIALARTLVDRLVSDLGAA